MPGANVAHGGHKIAPDLAVTSSEPHDQQAGYEKADRTKDICPINLRHSWHAAMKKDDDKNGKAAQPFDVWPEARKRSSAFMFRSAMISNDR
jgi:hypothetical protein